MDVTNSQNRTTPTWWCQTSSVCFRARLPRFLPVSALLPCAHVCSPRTFWQSGDLARGQVSVSVGGAQDGVPGKVRVQPGEGGELARHGAQLLVARASLAMAVCPNSQGVGPVWHAVHAWQGASGAIGRVL